MTDPPALADALVILGEAMTQWLPADHFSHLNCTPRYAQTIQEAEIQLAISVPDIVFMPLHLGDNPTEALLKSCHRLSPAPPVVVVASNDQINDAAEAMRLGAFDCLFHPFGAKRLEQALHSALGPRISITQPDKQHQAADNKGKTLDPSHPPAALETAQQPPARGSSERPATPSPAPAHPKARPQLNGTHLLGDHPSIRTVIQMLEDVAHSTAPVFLQGETGTEKEHYARSIHDLSGRAPDLFVAINCATLHPETMASDMFGHLAGAFPAARKDKIGAALAADGGTLFLDEVANLDLRTQSQLVRFLRSGTVQRLGSEQPEHVDVRVISTTSHDPNTLIKKGKLLSDLFYHLYVAPIHLPPLRERESDIALLAQHFLQDYSRSENRGFTQLSPDAIAVLQRHSWPGNIHELKNAIWNAVLHHDGQVLTSVMLPAHLRSDPNHPAAARPPSDRAGSLVGLSLADIEQIVIEDTIRAYGGSIPRAARVLGVSPSTIYRKREAWAAKPTKKK
ncbi:sigma-54 dependent transcriptional regulator [Aliiroseovarius crassostreae]|uniref:sigma-54-dependent transcriptional regulator n=1 Tax=Aliiroseovarius crassostreae TaxID=154981 RepID=UPI0021FA68D9|nr:sigma-54 dependent transcriptional regulator [Aliiroseovarius crassostreae]UWQ03826.1 sigma-54 dependent transcriptional regulator [Aliiroseovarius crassostreae]